MLIADSTTTTPCADLQSLVGQLQSTNLMGKVFTAASSFSYDNALLVDMLLLVEATPKEVCYLCI